MLPSQAELDVTSSGTDVTADRGVVGVVVEVAVVVPAVVSSVELISVVTNVVTDVVIELSDVVVSASASELNINSVDVGDAVVNVVGCVVVSSVVTEQRPSNAVTDKDVNDTSVASR